MPAQNPTTIEAFDAIRRSVNLTADERAQLSCRRRQLGLSLSALALRVGCSHTCIASIENGKRNPSSELLSRIQHILRNDQAASAEVGTYVI